LFTFDKTKKLRVIAKKTLREFWERHNDCEQQLKTWFQEASKAKWENHNEIKTEYPGASIIGNDRIVFNIKGNSYRLIVKINFDYQMIWIRYIGTHSEYDKVNAKTI
jgi:mRNA interferase HigB